MGAWSFPEARLKHLGHHEDAARDQYQLAFEFFEKKNNTRVVIDKSVIFLNLDIIQILKF